jgi:hypothetical protein
MLRVLASAVMECSGKDGTLARGKVAPACTSFHIAGSTAGKVDVSQLQTVAVKHQSIRQQPQQSVMGMEMGS